MNAFAAKPNLRSSSRLPSLGGESGVSVAEITTLLMCGAASALAVGLIHRSFGVPGIAILRGLLPMALGLAVVPRRSAGTAMSLVACATATLMNAANVGEFQVPALVGTLALGPMLDTALTGNPQGWHIYLRFAAAGAAANLFAFSSKFIAASIGWHFPGSGRVTTFWSLALLSFIVCGTLAGLISSAVWFRRRIADDLRRD